MEKVDTIMNLDEAVRKFKDYCQGKGDFDELDFKEYILDDLFRRYSDEIIGKDEEPVIGEQGKFDPDTRTFELITDSPAVKYHQQKVSNNNRLKYEQRQRRDTLLGDSYVSK